MFVLGICSFLFVLFAGLSTWQRRLERQEKRVVLENLNESISRGTNKAIGQSPQINPLECLGCGSCIAACHEDGVIGLVNGIAHVIHASRCVGHGLCESACPVGALKVTLGDVSHRPDIPVLSATGETTIPGLFIAGELGGLSLIRNALEQGSRVIDAVCERLKSVRESAAANVYDVLIVGAGPAGIAASLRAVEKKLNYYTISRDEVGGTVRKYPRRKLTLVQAVDVPLYGHLKGGEYLKEDLVEIWEQLASKFGLRLRSGLGLTGIQSQGGIFDVATTGGHIQARTVVLALGRRGTPRKLGVPGEESEKVMYQLMDAATYNNQHVLVVGGGDSAVEAATGLANQPGNTVTISYRKEDFFRLKSRNERRIREYISQNRLRVVFSSAVESIEPNSVNLMVDKGGTQEHVSLPNNFVLVFAGGEVPYPLLKQIGIGFGVPASKLAA